MQTVGGRSVLPSGPPVAPRKPWKAIPSDSPHCRAGLTSEALGPEVVLHHDDQGQVAGGQGA